MSGVAIGISIVAWGSWPSATLQRSILIQGLLLFTGVLVIESRTGVISLLIAGVFAVIRNLRQVWSIVVPLAFTALVLLAFAVQIMTHTDSSNLHASSTLSVLGPQVTDQWIESIVLREGTTSVRVSTWGEVVSGLTQDGTWLVGGAAGADYLYQICTGRPLAPDFVIEGEVCAVDDHGPEPVLRDPHNWVLNISLSHGLVGLSLYASLIVGIMWHCRRSPNSILPIFGASLYLGAGLVFVISGSYALLPISFFLAWVLRNKILFPLARMRWALGRAFP